MGFEHGGVQIVGRHHLAIHEDVIELPFLQLANMLANLLGALDPAHPAHAVLQAALVKQFVTAQQLPAGARVQ